MGLHDSLGRIGSNEVIDSAGKADQRDRRLPRWVQRFDGLDHGYSTVGGGTDRTGFAPRHVELDPSRTVAGEAQQLLGRQGGKASSMANGRDAGTGARPRVRYARHCHRTAVDRVAGVRQPSFRCISGGHRIGRADWGARPASDARCGVDRWHPFAKGDGRSRTGIDAAPTPGTVMASVQASGTVNRDGDAGDAGEQIDQH